MAGVFQRNIKSFIYFHGCKGCSSYSKRITKIVEFRKGHKIEFRVPLQIPSGCHGLAQVAIDNTVVSVSAVAKNSFKTNKFIPLIVDCSTKFEPLSKVRHSREISRNNIILTAKVIDRSIRPLFPSGLQCDIQVISKMICTNGEHSADVIGINAASACLATSSIPWDGPIAAVRVGYVNGKLITFPTRQELFESQLNVVVVVGRGKKIVMMEGSSKEVKKGVLKKAITAAIKESQAIISTISKLAVEAGSAKEVMPIRQKISEDILEATRHLSAARIKDVFTTYTYNKHSRDNEISKINKDVSEKLSAHFKASRDDIAALEIYNEAYNTIVNEVFRELILKDGIRIDGRKEKELRPITCAVNMYDSLHGSSRFTRGETIVQSSVTIESLDPLWEIDPLTGLSGNFILEYRSPPSAVGEIGNISLISRKEISHGSLARKALTSLIPEIPYGLYLNAEVIASNGSSSMATVCSGSMALLDAGINLSSPASGVAIGLVTKCTEDGDIEAYKLLTDTMGFEDNFGDMDVKLASTQNGITAVQADIKHPGVPSKILFEAIDKATTANNEILKKMKKVISEPKCKQSNHPVLEILDVSPVQRLMLQSSDGLKKILTEKKCEITWLTPNSASIFAENKDLMDQSLSCIDKLLKETVSDPSYGQICVGVIKEVLSIGVMVELLPGMKPSLVINSELSTNKMVHPEQLNLKIGDNLTVQYLGRHPISGTIKVSRKTLLTPGSKNIPKKRNINATTK